MFRLEFRAEVNHGETRVIGLSWSSGNIRFMQILAGVPFGWGVKRHWGLSCCLYGVFYFHVFIGTVLQGGENAGVEISGVGLNEIALSD